MNEQQRRQQEMQTAQRRFLQALSAGQVGAKDRFGRAVGPNMKVLFKLPFDLIWDVASVAPMLDPRQPPGLLVVTLIGKCTYTMMANQPDVNMIVMGTVEEQPKATRQGVDESAAEAHEHYIASGEIPGVPGSGDDAAADPPVDPAATEALPEPTGPRLVGADDRPLGDDHIDPF